MTVPRFVQKIKPNKRLLYLFFFVRLLKCLKLNETEQRPLVRMWNEKYQSIKILIKRGKS